MKEKVHNALTAYKKDTKVSETGMMVNTFIKDTYVKDKLCEAVIKTLVLFNYENLLPEIIKAVVEELVLEEEDQEYSEAEVIFQ